MVENFNKGNENISKTSFESNKEHFYDSKLDSTKPNSTKNIAKELLTIKREEKIDNEIGDFLDKINISKDDKEIIYKRLLEFSDNEELLNKAIVDIKDSETIDDVNSIINDYLKIYKEKEKNGEKTNEKQNLENLNNSLSGLDPNNENYGNIVEKVRALEKSGYPKEKVEEIIKQLKADDNALYHISKDLKESDKLNGTNTFNQFSSSLINMDSSFREKFDLINTDLVAAKQKTVLGVENLGGMNISGNVLRIKDNDGSITEAGKDGRKLSLAGSDYKLDSKINNGGALREISSIEEDFKKEMEEINRELDTLIAIMEYVDDAISNNEELSVVKQTIKSQNVNLYNEMNLDSLTSLEQVKNAFVVMIKQKEEEKEKKIKEKKGIIDEIVRQNALSAKEIDEKKKDILKFLHQIKFDMLPKDLTDQIINEFKSNIFSIPGLDLNKDTMDITNGKFGEGVNETGGDRWKDNLVKFMEKMIYGQIGTKESIFNGKQFKGELGANIDPLLINATLEQNGLKTELGWNINTIRDNLKKENTKK